MKFWLEVALYVTCRCFSVIYGRFTQSGTLMGANSLKAILDIKNDFGGLTRLQFDQVASSVRLRVAFGPIPPTRPCRQCL